MILLIVIPQKAKHATKTAQAQNSDKEMMNALSKNTRQILAHGWQKQYKYAFHTHPSVLTSFFLRI